MFMCLDSQKCGNTYESCTADLSEPLEIHVTIVIVVFIVIPAFTLGGCAYYCRIPRRKQARA